MKKVSVIIPIYNMAHTLRDSIEALLKQTYPNTEIIMINDGSKDNTFEICQEYERANKNIKVWHTENQGSGPARNLGIKKATGDYAYFMDADDVLSPDAISVLVEEITNQQSDLIIFGYNKKDSKGNLLTVKEYEKVTFSGDYIRDNYHLFFDMNFKLGIQGPPWNKLFDLKLIHEKKVEYPAMKRHQDEVFISRYVSHVKKVSFIEDVLYTHFINSIKSKQVKFPLNYIEIVKELNNHRLETVATWNTNNSKVLSLIYIEYIYNSIKAFDVIFIRKQLNKKQKLEWIKNEVRKIPVDLDILNHSNYANKLKLKQIQLFLNFVRENKIHRIYYMIKIRVLLETRAFKLVQFIKKNMVIKLGKN